MSLLTHDEARVRTLVLDRPDALNAFNEALYDATAQALLDAAADPSVAVVLLTGAGRAFSAGTDLLEMHQLATNPDLAFMSTAAKLKCPFTSLGVAPEAASSLLFPQLLGRQNAAWMLLSAEWISAAEAKEMGLVWRVCEPDDLLPEARRHAEILAARPISSLIAVKRTMTEPVRSEIRAAR